LDPSSWQVENTITVKSKSGRPVNMLNELEFYKRKLLANIYLTKKIGVIDLETGRLEK